MSSDPVSTRRPCSVLQSHRSPQSPCDPSRPCLHLRRQCHLGPSCPPACRPNLSPRDQLRVPKRKDLQALGRPSRVFSGRVSGRRSRLAEGRRRARKERKGKEWRSHSGWDREPRAIRTMDMTMTKSGVYFGDDAVYLTSDNQDGVGTSVMMDTFDDCHKGQSREG